MLHFCNAKRCLKPSLVLSAFWLLAVGLGGCGSSGLDSQLGLTTISTFSPTGGSAGTVVTVVGTNLGGSGALVFIHGVVIGNVTGSDTSIQFTIPANLPTGGNTITVNGITAGVFTNN